MNQVPEAIPENVIEEIVCETLSLNSHEIFPDEPESWRCLETNLKRNVGCVNAKYSLGGYV